MTVSKDDETEIRGWGRFGKRPLLYYPKQNPSDLTVPQFLPCVVPQPFGVPVPGPCHYLVRISLLLCLKLKLV